MSADDLIVPRASAPPVGLTPEQVAADLGWSVPLLWERIRAGSIPSPDWYAGRPQFPTKYAFFVRCFGQSLPGTYPVVILPMSATKLKARKKGKRKVGGSKPRKEQGKTAPVKPARKGGAR